MMEQRERTDRLPSWKRLLFAGVVLVMVGFALEAAARAVDAWTYVSVDELRDVYQQRRDWRLGRSWPVQRGDYPYLPFVPNPDHADVNELGFKGRAFSREKAANAYRIFCLGGSTTWNGYPAYLEEALREDFAAHDLKLEVINAGNQCWTSLESLINFITRCLPHKPDAIVVYHAINDAVFAFSDQHAADYTHLRKRFERDEPLVWDHLPSWFDHSAAFVGLRAIFERKVGTRGIEIEITKEIQSGEKRVYHGLEPLQQHLYTLVSVARARGIEVFLSTQVFNREYEYRFYLQQLWADAVDDANAIIRSLAGVGDDVHVLDPAATLRGNHDWMTDYCHFTDEGKGRLASFIANGIRPHVSSLVNKRRDTWSLALPTPPQPVLLGWNQPQSADSP